MKRPSSSSSEHHNKIFAPSVLGNIAPITDKDNMQSINAAIYKGFKIPDFAKSVKALQQRKDKIFGQILEGEQNFRIFNINPADEELIGPYSYVNYDKEGRVKSVKFTSTVNSNDMINNSQYIYDKTGELQYVVYINRNLTLKLFDKEGEWIGGIERKEIIEDLINTNCITSCRSNEGRYYHYPMIDQTKCSIIYTPSFVTYVNEDNFKEVSLKYGSNNILERATVNRINGKVYVDYIGCPAHSHSHFVIESQEIERKMTDISKNILLNKHGQGSMAQKLRTQESRTAFREAVKEVIKLIETEQLNGYLVDAGEVTYIDVIKDKNGDSIKFTVAAKYNQDNYNVIITPSGTNKQMIINDKAIFEGILGTGLAPEQQKQLRNMAQEIYNISEMNNVLPNTALNLNNNIVGNETGVLTSWEDFLWGAEATSERNNVLPNTALNLNNNIVGNETGVLTCQINEVVTNKEIRRYLQGDDINFEGIDINLEGPDADKTTTTEPNAYSTYTNNEQLANVRIPNTNNSQMYVFGR